MQQGLLESVTGRFLDGTPVGSVASSQRRLRSVIDHLHRLLNSRDGSVPHLARYGLPDISQVYRTLPGGAESLREAMRLTIEKYEPRLTKVKVTRHEIDLPRGRLEFLLSAQLQGAGPIRLQTRFSNSGEASVRPWRHAAGASDV